MSRIMSEYVYVYICISNKIPNGIILYFLPQIQRRIRRTFPGMNKRLHELYYNIL